MSTNFNEKQKSILREGHKVWSICGGYFIDKSSGRKISTNGSTVKDSRGTTICFPTNQQFKTFVYKDKRQK